MSREPEAIRISKTIAFLLRHRPDVGGLQLDEGGFVGIEELAIAVSKLLQFRVEATLVQMLVVEGTVRRFEISDGRIRAMDRSRGNPTAYPPDICYHACTQMQVDRYREQGHVGAPRGRSILLSPDESQAWRAAHRMGGPPRVLYVDASRARRHGVRFYRNKRNGLYMADSIPVNDVLNLRSNYAEQLSAGGIPLTRGPDGKLRMALIQVTRRSGITWEVAKGKLEHGEAPETTAIREVQEEMGIDIPMTIRATVGVIRYGFLAPGGLPRLKTVYLYLLDTNAPIDTVFHPSEREGIGDVRWFTPAEAVRAVRHSSLIPLMKKARRMVERR
jgi:putative RNA 2'-phosphotransferase